MAIVMTMKNKNIEWANKCTILDSKFDQYEGDIFVKCDTFEEPFWLFDSSHSKIFPGQKAKVVIGCLDSKEPNIILEKQKPNIVIEIDQQTKRPFITKGIGQVIKVFEGISGGDNKIVVDINGLLIEAIDRNKIKAKIGNYVELGQITYCWKVYSEDV